MCPAGCLMISELGRSHFCQRGGRHRCEDCPAIDVRNPRHRELIDQPGGRISWRWHRGGKPLCYIDMVFNTDHVLLTDATDQRRPNAAMISLTRTPCHYSGTRAWFECPSCCRRCAKLYYYEGRFNCRKCHGLGYRSQLEAKVERPRLIAHRIRRSLGASLSLAIPFPAKPPKMHWQTYYRIRAKAERFEARYMTGLAAWLEGRR
jgi:hypothetical protein